MKNSETKIRLCVSIPKELYEQIEEHSKKSFLGKTAWVIQAINEKLTKEIVVP